ncbi:MAG TPA: SDR family NAD(P)-dependent oxidoreductase [Bryobacteraceae bacterium]|jgi:NAD(P)-dependent dehydrogenase (short-subunit alcohol dehydrogenase family)|nr:SDR family NAD(P)-dependent oxidoreductase [Bryobacteraceae bacterium]
MSVIITGAGGGLGTVVCRAFLERGAQVIGVERSWRDHPAFIAISADLSTKEGCSAMIAGALKHGPIDAFVHLVGGFSGGSPVAETSDETWDLMMTVNLRAAFLAIRAALKPMIDARRGRIVAIGSRAAVEASPNFAAYAVSKAALVALVKNVAAEGKDSGITANVILPSTIDTPANRKAMPDADFSKWVAPDSIAKLIVWLVSDAADISGAVIPIYGRA